MRLDHKLFVRLAALLLVIGVIGISVDTASGQRRRTPRRTRAATPLYSIPADSIIRVRMDTELNSKTARVGDRFSTTVNEPAYSNNGLTLIPTGSKIWGRVSSVKRAGRRSPGSITVAFYSVELPSRRTYTINGSLSSLQADDVNADNEGSVSGRGNRKRDAVFIGGGAATGAVIGAIAGGGKGAAIGAILGGGLGTGARVYEREQEAEVKSGTEFGVILNRAVSLPQYRS